MTKLCNQQNCCHETLALTLNPTGRDKNINTVTLKLLLMSRHEMHQHCIRQRARGTVITPKLLLPAQKVFLKKCD